MFEVTIKYIGPYGETKYCTYEIRAKDRNAANNKALLMAGLNRQLNAIINDTIQIY